MIALDRPIVLEGREVTLRPLEAGDASEIATAALGLRALYPVSFVPDGADAAAKYVEDALRAKASGERYPFAIVWRGTVSGTTSYLDFAYWERCGEATPNPSAVEIGSTWLSRAAQRTRCNTESKYLLLAYAFENWRVARVSFKTDERNVHSRGAIERVGAQFEGVRRAEMLGADGAIRNSAYYSILADEWPAVRERLEAMLARDIPQHNK
jgi:RimJ/RimL family protein N-acetyltransferase